MQLWLIVPAKPFSQGKSRLSSALEPVARADLSRRLLANVVNTACASQCVAGALVVSRDPAVLNYAQELGCEPLLEHGNDLNSALEQARESIARGPSDAILILPSDLPLLTIDDIHQLHKHAVKESGVVIAPSRDGGTNALLLRPPDLFSFAFGPQSFERHCLLATSAGHVVSVVCTPSLEFDLDRPDDLQRLVALRPDEAWTARNGHA